ncbi:MAG TPA: sodium:proton exchanger, partial [Rikenellaceae bacterium]|nr:sodium:proton exchanger [Rikenellaceae bacterium]
MIVQILILVAGLALVVWGADALVDGASAVARRFGLSEFIIGLTIVGMGTSAPEMVVSFIGAAEGNADISLGNVVGSNVFNTLLILGITALLLPMPVTPENRKKDIPMNIVITLLLIGLGLEHTLFGFGTDGLSRWDGLVLVAVFVLYIGRSFRQGAGQEETPEAEKMPLWKAVLSIVLGLTALILGGNWFVDSATHIAKALGVSDKFIAITILAGGTSMPELATCVAAAVKKKG